MASTMEVDAASGASTIPVSIKHQGKKFEVEVDVSEPGAIFKYQVYSLTGVQPENQKILIKGRQVKDDTDMAALGLKPGQAIMVLGQAGAVPTRLVKPEKKVTFAEDGNGVDGAIEDALIQPGGLKNLGNTCYMNASLQAMRSLPELQDALVNKFKPNLFANNGDMLAQQLRDVFNRLSHTQLPFAPERFLETLRVLNPRFAERSRSGPGFAQQDAEEAWTFIVDNLRRTLLIKDGGGEGASAGASSSSSSTAGASAAETPDAGPVSIIKRYLGGEMEKTLVCDEPEVVEGAQAEAAAAAAATTRETFLTLPCHITITTNHLRDGLLAGLTEKIEKHSEALGRNASFTSTSKIARLPKYLTVHFVRFYWKRDIQKKAKIMRKVTFPMELDISEMCTDELRTRLIPVREKVREVRKEIEEMERSNKKRKRAQQTAEARGGGSSGSSSSSNKKPETGNAAAEATASTGDAAAAAAAEAGAAGAAAAGEEDVAFKTDAEIEAEKRASIEKAKEELYQLAQPRLEEDRHANHTGLYELRAVVAHQGAGADSGHYTAFVKKGTIVDPKTGRTAPPDGNWWWFNDDNVTEVTSERIAALAGGGESHSALILLYGSVPLPLPDGRATDKFSQS